jgi:hypothetical protein
VHAESGRFLSARTDFFLFVLSGQQQGCACRNFFCAVRSTAGVRMQEFFFVLSGHLFSAGRAQFFWTLLLSPRAMHACQGRQFFLSSRFQQLRVHFFSATLYCRVRSFLFLCLVAVCRFDSSRINFLVTRRCVTRAARKIFFLSLPCRSVRDAGRASQFFFFCRPVSSAQTLGRNLFSSIFADFYCFIWYVTNNSSFQVAFFQLVIIYFIKKNVNMKVKFLLA